MANFLNLLDFAKDKEKVAEEKEMIEFAKNNLIKDIFGKKKIVFTGDMSKSRAEMRAIAIRYGADSPTSISGKTNMLVIGEEAGKSKLEKAKQLGIIKLIALALEISGIKAIANDISNFNY